MIVEFIGVTGAGKTTLFNHVRRQLANQGAGMTAFEVAAKPVGLQRVAHPTAQNLIQELLGFPYFLGSLKRHGRFHKDMVRLFANEQRLSIALVAYLRSLERTVGIQELLRTRAADQVVLVDEGPLVLAHTIFVFGKHSYSAAAIKRFAECVPLPDKIVHVTAPVETLLQRALQRPDPPRELPAHEPARIEQFLRRAVSVYEQLIAIDRIRERTVTVNNTDSQAMAIDLVGESIMDFIQNGRGSIKRRPQ